MATKTSNPYLILFPLWLLVFSSSSQIIIIAPILPRISETLAIPDVLQGSLITAYAVMVGISALLMGPISDKVGRRRMLLAGSGMMTFALLLHMLVFDYYSFLAVRAAAGACGGLLSGAAVAFVGDYFPYHRRGWAAGLVMSGLAAGQIVGIPLGTVLADWFGFRIPFLMFAVTMAVAFVLIWRYVPQPDVQFEKERLSIRVYLGRFWDLAGRSETRAALFTYFLMFLSLSLYIVYLPTWLERGLDVGGAEIGSLFFVGGIASVVAGPKAGKLSDTLGRKPIIIASCLGLVIVMPLTTVVIGSMVMAYVIFSLITILFAIRVSPLQALLTALVPDNRRGMLLSTAVAVGQVGIGLGSAVSGPVFASTGYGSTTYLAAGAILLMAVVVWIWLPEPTQEMDSASLEV